MITVRSTPYKSNVRQLQKNIDARAERAVGQAARDAAAHTRAISQPSVSASATPAVTTGAVVIARVVVPGSEFWATMFDKGTLGKRELPLKQPGRREQSWEVRRRIRGGNTLRSRSQSLRTVGYIADRQKEALESGGIEPQYFFVRGKRYGQKQIVRYLTNGL